MLDSVTPKRILHFVEEELKKELFDDNGNLKIDITEYKAKAKKKRGEEVALRKEGNVTHYSDFITYNLGYNGTLYKIQLIVNENTKEVIVTGFLDANSDYCFFVSNIDFSKKQKQQIELYKEHLALFKGNNSISGFRALVLMIEGEL